MQSLKGTEMLTREKAIEEHRKMWRWLAEHPAKGKFDYFSMIGYKDNLISNCFLCQFGHEQDFLEGGVKGRCAYCPLDWGENKYCTADDDNGLFDKWTNFRLLPFGGSGRLSEISEIARQISELPERSLNEKVQNKKI